MGRSGATWRRLALAEVKLPTPKAILIGSSVVVVCAWFFLDFVVTDPATILFAFIVLGSDFLVRNLTSGFFTDRYWPVVAAMLQEVRSVKEYFTRSMVVPGESLFL